MNGMLSALMLAALVAAGLWLLRVRGAVLMMGLAALALGLAAYALAGSPGLPSTTRSGAGDEAATGLPLDRARAAFFGEFSEVGHWFALSDSYARRGKLREAAQVMQSAVHQRPNDYRLWIGLGNALVDHARVLTPPARHAFDRARALAPNAPATRFFLGLALVRSGDRAAGVNEWRVLQRNFPATASWQGFVADGVRAFGAADPVAAAPTR